MSLPEPSSEFLSSLDPGIALPRALGGYEPAGAMVRRFRRVLAGAGAREEVFGHSSEGRPLSVFEIGSSGPVVMLTSLMHGSEWVGAAGLQAVLGALVASPLLGRMRLVVVPMVNPDAVFANSERLLAGRAAWQRCNARGVDLNRNFSRLGESLHPFSGSRFRWSPHHNGPEAFSEVESRALRDLCLRLRPAIGMSFHGFGEMLLYPWGYRRGAHPKRDVYERLGAAMNAAMPGRPYRVKPSIDLYPTIGDFEDFLDHELGTLAMTVEVGALGSKVLHPARVLNPFCWMNPPDVEDAVRLLPAGILALLGEAIGLV